jgi:hypothetical protein
MSMSVPLNCPHLVGERLRITAAEAGSRTWRRTVSRRNEAMLNGRRVVMTNAGQESPEGQRSPTVEASRDESDALAIDEGFRRWYPACQCCLGECYPDVKAALAQWGLHRGAPKDIDRERAG